MTEENGIKHNILTHTKKHDNVINFRNFNNELYNYNLIPHNKAELSNLLKTNNSLEFPK